MIKVSKYEFDSQDQAESKINALPSVKDEDGKDVPSHKHTIVKLGKIVLEQGEYDETGEETKAPVLSDKFFTSSAPDLFLVKVRRCDVCY